MYGNEVEPVFFEQPWYAGSQVFKGFNYRIEHFDNREGSDRDVVVCQKSNSALRISGEGQEKRWRGFWRIMRAPMLYMSLAYRHWGQGAHVLSKAQVCTNEGSVVQETGDADCRSSTPYSVR